ncbi:MAG: hypothetical protein Q7V56_01105 [Gammaproteobacteria bacterium]|nr:hypothetical protein [Gammaproteobacteria bacterium]
MATAKEKTSVGLRARAGATEDNLISKEVTQDGMTVRVEAELAGAGAWVLRVIGRRGQVSQWTEFFSSSAEALTTGLTAIRYEGIEDFYDDPVFRYLWNEKEPLQH